MSDDAPPPEAAPARRIVLPARMDPAAAEELAEALEHLRGAPVILDGAAVDRPGGLFLQLLAIAAKQWNADGVPFQLSAPSPSLEDALTLLDLASLFQEDAAPCH
ncbi:MAG: STAS domain-containing protein [Alkalilacustris sp.]